MTSNDSASKGSLVTYDILGGKAPSDIDISSIGGDIDSSLESDQNSLTGTTSNSNICQAASIDHGFKKNEQVWVEHGTKDIPRDATILGVQLEPPISPEDKSNRLKYRILIRWNTHGTRDWVELEKVKAVLDVDNYDPLPVRRESKRKRKVCHRYVTSHFIKKEENEDPKPKQESQVQQRIKVEDNVIKIYHPNENDPVPSKSKGRSNVKKKPSKRNNPQRNKTKKRTKADPIKGNSRDQEINDQPSGCEEIPQETKTTDETSEEVGNILEPELNNTDHCQHCNISAVLCPSKRFMDVSKQFQEHLNRYGTKFDMKDPHQNRLVSWYRAKRQSVLKMEEKKRVVKSVGIDIVNTLMEIGKNDEAELIIPTSILGENSKLQKKVSRPLETIKIPNTLLENRHKNNHDDLDIPFSTSEGKTKRQKIVSNYLEGNKSTTNNFLDSRNSEEAELNIPKPTPEGKAKAKLNASTQFDNHKKTINSSIPKGFRSYVEGQKISSKIRQNFVQNHFQKHDHASLPTRDEQDRNKSDSLSTIQIDNEIKYANSPLKINDAKADCEKNPACIAFTLESQYNTNDIIKDIVNSKTLFEEKEILCDTESKEDLAYGPLLSQHNETNQILESENKSNSNVVNYKKLFGTTNVGNSSKHKSIRDWSIDQRMKYAKGLLSIDQERLLRDIGFDFQNSETSRKAIKSELISKESKILTNDDYNDGKDIISDWEGNTDNRCPLVPVNGNVQKKGLNQSIDYLCQDNSHTNQQSCPSSAFSRHPSPNQIEPVSSSSMTPIIISIDDDSE